MGDSGVVKGIGLGVAAGVMSGLFGIGGGAVLVPLLVLWVAMPQHAAHATSLAAIILTAAWGAATYAFDGSVDYAAGGAIAVGAIVAAWFGAALMHRLSAQRLGQAFGLLVIVVAVQMLFGFTPAGGGYLVLSGVAAVVGYLVLGFLAGGLSAVMGVGGGVIMVPAMVLLFGLTQHTAQGTSLLIIIPTAIIGALRHTRHGYTDWRMGLTIGIGGILGAWGGATIALALDSELLQRLFAIFLLITGARLLMSKREGASDQAAPDPVASEVA